ncbi:family 20 glycosylhydrolase [Neisseria sp. 83E34]|uniref:family 20 glycosylhydrolase n=1 Tax=Neisseria sp. 83E34 TaxID=1692264 RepID=UPI0018D1E779|nr:family 20 glycosylhydrolase [Neisseria sp. 83E34]
MSDIENGQLIAQELNSEGALALEEQETYQLFTENWVVPEDQIQTAYNHIGYTHLAKNASVDVADDSSAVDSGAEEIAPINDSGSGKMPWIVGGSGLLLAGLAAAAAGGSSGGSSDDGQEKTARKRSMGEERSATQPAASTEEHSGEEHSAKEDQTPSTAGVTAESPAASAEEAKPVEDPVSSPPAGDIKPPEEPAPKPETKVENSTPENNNVPESTPSVKENVVPETTEGTGNIVDPNHSATEQAEPVPQPAVNGKQSGLTLDIAKHFYSADVIKKYIDTISKSGGTFLQLHLSDDENYAFESTVLDQRAANATQNEDGTYTNPKTGKQFLSYEQIADIVSHAKAKGVELIPEIDTPNHMDAIFDLLEHHKGADYVQSIKSEVVNDEIKITDPKAIDFVKSLYTEVIGLMQGNSKHFHIGGDEFGYSALNNHEFITYANTLSKFLDEQGLKTRMWNDGLLKTSLKELNPAIEITYWSYDGNPGVDSVAADRRAERASMKDLLDEGFDVLNYNWYYLYFVPDDGVTNAESGAHMASDIQAMWDLGVWDGKDHSDLITNTGKVIGSSLTIWGENADNLTDDQIYEWSANGLAALISKTNADSINKDDLSRVTLDITKENRDGEVINLKSSASELVDVSLADDLLSSYSFVWLNGDTDDMLTLSSDWSFTGASELKDNVSYSLYKHGSNHLYVDTDIVVEVV